MTAIVEFTVPSDAFELGKVFQIPSIRVRLFQLVPRGNRFVPYMWVQANDVGLSEFETRLSDDDRIDQVVTVEKSGDEGLYHLEWATELNGLFAGFRSHGLSVESAQGTAETWEFRVFNSEHERLESFQAYCADHDIPLDVERVYHPTPSDEPSEWGMTPEQREAVVTAYEEGYFNVPQDVSLEDLGSRLGISRQAASARIHRGLENLLSVTLLDDDAGL